MNPRWYKEWPMWAPKTIEVEKPASEYMRTWAELLPNGIALCFYGNDITYAHLNNMADRMAWGLKSLGVERGDRVAVHMENCPQFVIAYFGAQRAGAVVVPVNPMLKAAELEFEINDAGAQTLIGIDALYPEVDRIRTRTSLKNVILTSPNDFLPDIPILAIPEEARQDSRSFPDTIDFMELINSSRDDAVCDVSDLRNDLALLQYTGGTTGTPKGAMISHYSLAYAALGSMHWYRFREDDVFLGVTPFFHVMGQVVLMVTPLVSGGRVVVLSRFVPEVVAQAVAQYRCTFLVGPTTMMIALLNLPNINTYDFSSLRCVWSGGTSISVELQNKVRELVPGAAIGEGYGLSEVITQGGACTPLYRSKPGFVGLPQIGVEIRIVDRESGAEMPPNEPGEIIIRSPATMVGYWNKPGETREMLRDGWLFTGDSGLLDEDGYLKFLGRTRELIKCSGFSVFPSEVEDLLHRHPAIREVAVIGVDDPYRGESPKAFIVLRDGYAGKIAEDDVIEWCRDNMAAYKRPKHVEFREELPKTAAGKVQKTVLKQQELREARSQE